MGVLRYAILGLLNRKSMTGYDLAKEFQASLSEFWGAKHSQIYPELKLLTEQNLVTYTTEITGTVLEKKLYSITELGREEFLRWEASTSVIPVLPKDNFKLQLFFSDCISTEQQLGLLRNQLEQHEQLLAHLQNNLKRFATVPPADDREFSDYLVLSGAISREEASCNWLKQCMELCKSHANP